jgi:hypothetical protein
VLAGTLKDVGDRSLAAMWVVRETLKKHKYTLVNTKEYIKRRTAPLAIWKWSSMRKGVKFRSCDEPIERRTRAPAPYQRCIPVEEM